MQSVNGVEKFKLKKNHAESSLTEICVGIY